MGVQNSARLFAEIQKRGYTGCATQVKKVVLRNPIRNLCFVEEGMAAMTTTFEDGSQVEVCMFGYESVTGISALMGTKRSLNRVYTQIAGYGYSCRLEVSSRA